MIPAFHSVRLVETELIRLGTWSCNPESEARWTAERSQPWPTVTFCDRGAFAVTEDGYGRLVVDGNAALVVDAEQRYATRRILLGTGTNLAIHPEVARTLREGADHGPDGAEGADGRRGARRPLSIPLPTAARLDEAALFSPLRRQANSAPDVLACEEQALGLAAKLLRARDSMVLAPRAQDHVEATKSFLANRFRGQLSLAEISRSIGLSPFHLTRLFKAATGTSLYRYVIHLRLAEALDRLAEPRIDLSALALDLGFSHQSHFTSAFRHHYARTPGQVRLLLRGRGPHAERVALSDRRAAARRRAGRAAR